MLELFILLAACALLEAGLAGWDLHSGNWRWGIFWLLCAAASMTVLMTSWVAIAGGSQ